MSYALFLFNELRNCKHFRFHRNSFIISVYLITSLTGRFGVGFVGLAFNLQEEGSFIAPLMRPDWHDGVSKLQGNASSITTLLLWLMWQLILMVPSYA